MYTTMCVACRTLRTFCDVFLAEKTQWFTQNLVRLLSCGNRFEGKWTCVCVCVKIRVLRSTDVWHMSTGLWLFCDCSWWNKPVEQTLNRCNQLKYPLVPECLGLSGIGSVHATLGFDLDFTFCSFRFTSTCWVFCDFRCFLFRLSADACRGPPKETK